MCRQSPRAAQWSKEGYDQAHYSGQILLTAELNGQVCGFLLARIIGDEAEILNMAVDKLHRRHRIGSGLLTAAISAAQAQNTQNIYLEVRESISAAIFFYGPRVFENAT